MQTPAETSASFLPKLPAGFDDRTRLALATGNRILAAHPDHPAVVYDEQRGVWVPLGPPNSITPRSQ